MLKRIASVFILVCAAVSCVASDLVDLSVVTSKGYVTYTVPGDWTVLDMHTKAPKTSAVFQIKTNPAEVGTSDSTNLAILTFENSSAEANGVFEKMVAKARAETSARAKHGAWQLFSLQVHQGKTMYQARNAFRDVPGAHVFVTCAWPQLPKNPTHYDADIQAAFFAVLDSVKGTLGTYHPTGREVIRRPIDQ